MSSSESEISSVVDAELQARNQDWNDIPLQGAFSRERIMDRAYKIQSVLTDVSGSNDYLGASGALDTTYEFVSTAFDVYEGKKESAKFDWVFAVPGRVEDFQDNEYASEVTPFLPILDPKYGATDLSRQLTTMSLVPSVIETYHHREGDTERGAVVWTPFYINAVRRLDAARWRQFVVENTPGIRQSVNDTARFVRQRLGATVMGLGASIPSFTRMGKSIHEEGLTTTTGHAGTVYLLNETVQEVIEKMELDGTTIGLLGAGSIGASWAELHATQTGGKRINVYDRDDTQMSVLVDKLYGHKGDSYKKLSEIELLRSSDVIVSAINRTLDLDMLELEFQTRIDLTGKVIIDDSQPGAFERDQVESRGGRLVWVVGQDRSPAKVLHRTHGYNFGDTAGLFGEGSVWGCEAEAAAIFLESRPDLAVSSHVNPEAVVAVGALCRQIGIEVADPLQSFGQPVELDTGFSLFASGL